MYDYYIEQYLGKHRILVNYIIFLSEKTIKYKIKINQYLALIINQYTLK